jgi:hypothetical protein
MCVQPQQAGTGARHVQVIDVGQSHFFSLPWTGSGFGILPRALLSSLTDSLADSLTH